MFAVAPSYDALVEELRAADAAIARALDIMCATPRADASGMPLTMRLMLESGWTRTDVRMLGRAADVLAGMPLTRAAFRSGKLSWSQVRALVSALSRVDAPTRESLDGFIARAASGSVSRDPDDLLRAVDEEVERLRDDLLVRRERRAIGRGFIAVQGRLDGTGSFYGEADAESLATLVEALDSVSCPPVNSELHDLPSRAQQRFDALISIAEASLSGAAAGARPRPRIYATVDAGDLTEGARILWPVPGRPARLSSLSTEALLCDANVIPAVFDHGKPVAIGEAQATIPEKSRRAVIARDGGCRFPGCSAPASWADVHHIVHRARGGLAAVDNLVLLCRRCHRRVHLYRWRLKMNDDGTMNFSHRGTRYMSVPRARPLARQ